MNSRQETGSNVENKKKEISRYYKRCALISVLLYAAIALFAFYCQWVTKIPEKLNQISGVLGVEYVGRQTVTTINDGDQVHQFTCATGIGSYSDCISQEKMAEMSGKNASVKWYFQKYPPFSVKKKLVILTVDDQEVVSEEATKLGILFSRKLDFWLYAAMGVFVLFLSMFYFRKSRIK